MPPSKAFPAKLSAIITIIILLVLPGKILVDHYLPGSGFLGLIYFGQEFSATQLPQVRALSPPMLHPSGYDGQFYAQLALQPSLSGQDIVQALDNAQYRARRIGLPFLAFCLGLGNPSWTLQAYALLNFAFWGFLFAALWRYVGLARCRDVLLAASLLWTTGALVSLARSLTDFPAAVLGCMAILSGSRWLLATALLGGSALIKETSIFSFAAAPWNQPESFRLRHTLTVSALLFLPVTIWFLYVSAVLPGGDIAGERNFALPLAGFFLKVTQSLQALFTEWGNASPSIKGHLLFETLAPVSLFFQAAYLILKPRIHDPAWRFGTGFVLLFMFLGSSVWADQNAYTRVLLPLTFAFNLLLHKDITTRSFAAWYALGNAGMSWMFFKTLLQTP